MINFPTSFSFSKSSLIFQNTWKSWNEEWRDEHVLTLWAVRYDYAIEPSTNNSFQSTTSCAVLWDCRQHLYLQLLITLANCLFKPVNLFDSNCKRLRQKSFISENRLKSSWSPTMSRNNHSKAKQQQQQIENDENHQEATHWKDVLRTLLHYEDFIAMDIRRRQEHLNRLPNKWADKLPAGSYSKLEGE